MTAAFDEQKKQVRALSRNEKAELARILIEDVDSTADPNAEQLWVEETQRRYDAYRAGELSANAGDDVMKRVRDRLE